MPAAQTADKPKARRYRDGVMRRQLLIEAATEIIGERGYHKARLADIAAAAGCTQAGLLHHFPSKDHLLVAVLEARDSGVVDTDDIPGTQAGMLPRFLRRLRDNEARPELMGLMAFLSAESIAADHPTHQAFVDRYERLVAEMTQDVRRLLKPGMRTNVDPEQLARILIATADGMRLQLLYSQRPMSRMPTLMVLVELLRPFLRDADLQVLMKAVQPSGHSKHVNEK